MPDTGAQPAVPEPVPPPGPDNPRTSGLDARSALSVLGLTVLIVVASLVVIISVMSVLQDPSVGVSGQGIEIALIAFQASLVGLTLWASRLFGPYPQTLGLHGRIESVGWLVVVVGVMCVAWAASLWLSLNVFREQMLQDIATYKDAFFGEAQTRVVAIVSTVIGAPVSEELLFRGFLLGGLIRFGVGVWLAVLISNGLWTGMHAGYSALGLIEVFVAGLFLSAAFLVSRSIWPPIVLHVLFNVAALVVMVAVVGA